jgi:hypothetical protein
MRNREFYDQEVSSDFEKHYISDTGSVSDPPYSGITAVRQSSMSDVETPNFKARSLKGEVILSPMTKSVYDLKRMPATTSFSLHHENKPVGEEYRRYDEPHWPIGDITRKSFDTDFGILFDQSDDNRNEAIAHAWANVDECEIQLLASLGELPETIRWIASIYRKSLVVIRLYNRKLSVLSAMYLAFKKTRKRDIADGFAQLWLEYRYAFRPLVFEMKQAVDAAHKSIKKNSRATGRGFKLANVIWTSNYETRCWEERTIVTWLRTHTSYTTYRAGVLYQIEDDLSSILAVWGIDQPLESAWELLPFSFIIDWFFNIGDIIAMWTDNAGLTPLGSWCVENRVLSITDIGISVRHGSLPSNNLFDWGTMPAAMTNNGSLKSVGQYKRRVINPAQSYIPSVKLNLDLAKIFDLATIARLLFKSGGRVKIGGTNVR